VTALGFKKNAIVLCGGTLFQNGQKIENNVGCHLDELKANQTIAIMIDSQRNLKYSKGQRKPTITFFHF